MNTYQLQIESGDCIAVGLDIGSTTAKLIAVDGDRILYECYERHFSQVRQKALELLDRIRDLTGGKPLKIAISGSAGMGLAKAAQLPFVQEVFATAETVRTLAPDTSVVIELGGEDAKVIFFKGGLDERMNGSCAGGTGAFIDQMATLLNLTPAELDEKSLASQRIYPIASRCGVFAKSDIQPLLNQGATKEDIAASIYQAVVNQTIAGLAQGRRMEGKIMFLGGPLYYCQGLRRRFTETLKLSPENALFPAYARMAVSIGAALYASKQRESFTFDEARDALTRSVNEQPATSHLPALFRDRAEYGAFLQRHARATVPKVDPATYTGDAYLGIDCGSTTTKLTLIGENGELLYSYYNSNRGTPVDIVKEQLLHIRRLCADRIHLRGSAVTGYGEELILHAFHIDHGLVETMAHFTAARFFNPKVDFILDIGGQDMKCFRIQNNSIDSIMLNEACSSGCGSFIETFARAMGYEAAEFSELGLFAKAPVDLGSRCTVFMNSSVKQAQKDGATVEDISAGLSISVVKNAIYKVIRAASADELGEHIVVQGGTFLNNAVLRSFEMELNREVIRPEIAGLMGAFGAALYAKAHCKETTTTLDLAALESFTHESKTATCKGCGNQCHLTVNIFSGGERYIIGNKCERGAGLGKDEKLLRDVPNLHEYKRQRLISLPEGEGTRGVIGLPLALGMYELAPFWNALFRSLGYKVITSGFSSRALYAKGQYSIPSDTACYPAKLMHGHIEELIERGVDAIFYPCLTYNFDEKISDNHYNCPVVAYYSELLRANVESLRRVKFLYPYLNINDRKQLVHELFNFLPKYLAHFTHKELRHAVDAAYRAYDQWMRDIRAEGKRARKYARANGKHIMILAGRPYHVDPEIGHGIDKLATSLGFVVVSEDSFTPPLFPPRVNVLNQWTYHARLYAAAEYAGTHKDTELVQLVSFGCGIDAITTDEVHAILHRHGKLYTQIKIDEITNLGAVKIRLRSLMGALAERAGSDNFE